MLRLFTLPQNWNGVGPITGIIEIGNETRTLLRKMAEYV